MGGNQHRLIIVGDVGVDLVLGPISEWPRVGTEALVERSELRAGGSAGNAALAVSYLGGHAQLLSVVGNDDPGAWLRGQLQPLGATLAVCDAPTTLSVGLIHSCGERTFFTTRGHLEAFSYDILRPLIPPAPDAGSIALLSGVFLTPALRSAYPLLIGELHSLGYHVALDTNWPPQGWSAALREEVATWVAATDHVLLNELEVRSLADAGGENRRAWRHRRRGRAAPRVHGAAGEHVRHRRRRRFVQCRVSAGAPRWRGARRVARRRMPGRFGHHCPLPAPRDRRR